MRIESKIIDKQVFLNVSIWMINIDLAISSSAQPNIIHVSTHDFLNVVQIYQQIYCAMFYVEICIFIEIKVQKLLKLTVFECKWDAHFQL